MMCCRVIKTYLSFILLLACQNLSICCAAPENPTIVQTQTLHPQRTGKKSYFGKRSARKISEGVQAALAALQHDPFSAESVWDQDVLKKQTHLASRLQEFMAGTYGQSVKNLKISGLTVDAVHALLIEKGFQEQQVKRRDSRQGEDAHLEPKHQKIYVNPDGGIVRLKPLGHRWHTEPHAVKCVLKDPQAGTSYVNEAFKVTDDGHPVPKNPRPEDGLRRLGVELTHPDHLFGWTDVIMEEGHIPLNVTPKA